MRFYDLIQLDPGTMRQRIAKTANVKQIRRMRLAMVVRSVLIVLFSILFVSLMNMWFGAYNSSMAIALFCVLLAVRFVGYGYNIYDSLLGMLIVFALLLVSPVVAATANFFVKLIVYIISLLIIMVLTTRQPQMGNGGLYTFSFVFLCQNPVYGQQFIQRAELTLLGFVLCGLVLWRNHKDEFKTVRLSDVIKDCTIHNKLFQWQLRLALGVGIVLSIFSIVHAERFMWIGFACGSLLSDYNVENNVHEKFTDRLVGAVLGSFAFYALYELIPMQFHALFGPIGGVCLGLCTSYKYKTMINCFGALMIASTLYGVQNAVLMRMSYTLIGILAALIFYYLYDHFLMKGLLRKGSDPIAESFKS